MENNEIMNYEDIEVMDDTFEVEEKAGMSTGVAMLIGAGVTLAVTAGVGLVKKAYAKYKAKKAINKPEGDIQVDDQAVVDVAAK